MIRVLSIIHYPVFGGPHNRNLHVGDAAKARGVVTTVLLPDEPGNAAARLRDAGLDVLTMPLSRLRATLNPIEHLRLIRRFWGDVVRIRKVIRERQIDLVQLNGLVNWQGALAARLERIPVVWQILDTFPPMALRNLIMPLVRGMADVVMCTGQRVAESHPGALAFGDRLVLFFPPVNTGKFVRSDATRTEARKRLGIKDDEFVVGNVGNINPQKGHRTFVQAAAAVKQAIPNARFVILGAAHDSHRRYADSVWAEAAALGLRKGNELIVRDPEADVACLMQAFDLFWMTSVPRSEGIPTAVEEAMALGLPVVATGVGSVAEIVQDDETGYVVEAGDVAAIADRTARLIGDDDLRNSMGRKAEQIARRCFGVETCVGKHCHAYELALANSVRRQ